MAVHLSCPLCAGSIEADALALRREIVCCQYCSSVFRVNEKGLQPTKDRVELLKPVKGVVIKRDDKKGLLLTGLIAKSTINLNFSNWQLFLILSFFIMPFFLIVTLPLLIISLMDNKLPPMRVKNGRVQGCHRLQKALRSEDIKQLFVVANNIRFAIDQDDYYSASLFALTKEDKRVMLLGPLRDAESALYIEEYLELELGIFNLAVAGEEKASTVKVRENMEMIKEQNCSSCGAELTLTDEIIRKGSLTCPFCESLHLVYDPAKGKPLLGAGKDNKQFIFSNVENCLLLKERGSQTALLSVSAEELSFKDQSIPVNGIRKFSIGETEKMPDSLNPLQLLKGLCIPTDKSGDIDYGDHVKESLGLVSFDIYVNFKDKKLAKVILRGINSKQEAESIQEDLNRFINKI